MGFFSKLFGQETKTQQKVRKVHDTTTKKVGKPFFTNAPENWGIITDEFLQTNQSFVKSYDANANGDVDNHRMFMVNALMLIGTITETFKKNVNTKIQASYTDALLGCKDQYATSICVQKLFDKGVINTSGIVIDDYERYAVMLFVQPTPMSYINELKALFLADGYKDLIYFSQTDPNTVTGNQDIRFDNFNAQSFSFSPEKQGKSNRKHYQYAMWWPSEQEPDFLRSEMKENIETYLQLFDNYNSYALGLLSFAFNLKKDTNRTKLPEYDEVTIQGPEGVEIIITLSQTKGINYHFPILPEYEVYRNRFIKVYLIFASKIKAQIDKNNFPKDDFGHASTLDWYHELIDAYAKAPMESIGLIE